MFYYSYSKNVINVEKVDVLKWILEIMLSRGVTCDISQKDYEEISSGFVNAMSSEERYNTINIIGKESFFNIVDSINKSNHNIEPAIKLHTVEGKEGINTLARPWYGLKYDRLDEFWKENTISRMYPRHREMFSKILMSTFESEFAKQELDDMIKKYALFRDILIEDESPKKYQMSKNVAGFLVEDLIKRYVESKIKEGKWPSQCKDIDKYIFERDIASAIDESGTCELFRKLYIHTINTICRLLKQSGKQVIKISNNSYNMLAHANYLKILIPEELKFLHKYVHNPYEEKDKSFVITINQDNATYSGCACVDSDPYGEWSDTYEYYDGNVSNEFASIMEKRIGKI